MLKGAGKMDRPLLGPVFLLHSLIPMGFREFHIETLGDQIHLVHEPEEGPQPFKCLFVGLEVLVALLGLGH